jgi:hypothetical protein
MPQPVSVMVIVPALSSVATVMAGAISDWGALQARVLFESVPVWAERKVITMIEWEKKFKATKKRSRAAFAAFYGVEELWQVLMRRS